MTPVVWAVVGFVAGLIVMWLIMRLTVLKAGQEHEQSLNARVADSEATHAKNREEIGKLESRLQHRETDNTDLKERLSKTEGQLRERQQTVGTLEAQVVELGSVRSDLERAIRRLEDRLQESDLRLREMEASALTTEAHTRQQQLELDKLRDEAAERDARSATLAAQLAQRDRELAEAEDILDRQRVTLRSSSGADKGLRAAVNRQQAEINALRQKLEDALQQASSRNQRLTQLQETLSERKNIIAELRHQLREVARPSTLPAAIEPTADDDSQPERSDEPGQPVDLTVVEADIDSEEVAVGPEAVASTEVANEPDEAAAES